MPEGNEVGGQIFIVDAALLSGLHGAMVIGSGIPWYNAARLAVLGTGLFGGQVIGIGREGTMGSNAGLFVGIAQTGGSLLAGAALPLLGITAAGAAPFLIIAATSFVMGEAALYLYENNIGRTADYVDAAINNTADLTGAAWDNLSGLLNQVGDTIGSAFNEAMANAGDFINDFANAAAQFSHDFQSALENLFHDLSDSFSGMLGPDAFDGLFGPDGPLGPNGIFGPDGLFSPDSPFGPYGLAGPLAPLGLLGGLADLLAGILADPIVLDLDGDGIELVPLAESATMFDLDGDGVAERAGWVSPQDGFLVQDSNGNGIVDGMNELFGSANVDGYDELKTLDINHDGRIDAADPAFAELRVWRDLNSDGISTPNELQTLAEAGIARLNLGYSQVDQNVSGNVIARTGNYVRADGTSRSMGSVNFALDEITPFIPEGADLGDLITLPNLSGQLGLPDLRTAMFYDPILRDMVEELTYGTHNFDTFAEFRDGGFLDVLYRWAGIDTSAPLSPGDQPYYVQLMAAFMGRLFDGLVSHQVERLDEVWPEFIKQLGIAFLVQAADLPAIQPFYQMQDALAALDPDGPGFADALSSILSNAIADSDAAEPAYNYLNDFALLDFNPSTGEITGNFEAFLAEFMESQPPYDPGVSAYFVNSNLPSPLTAWQIWYNEQGSLIYAIADLMGYGPEYVRNATGWGWLEEGAMLMEGSNGADIINAPSGNQVIFGYDGNDQLLGNGDNDRLIGGEGDDLLKGGSGSDMYVYASGDGLDRIIEQSGADDTIYFSPELNKEDLQVIRVAGTNDLLLHFGNATEGIILTNQWTSSACAVEHVNFGVEGSLRPGDLSSIYLATLATPGADTIAGSWADERLIGLDGDDNLSGLDGDDSIEGGIGNDVLNGGNDDDILVGSSGNDSLLGGANNDLLNGGSGDDMLDGGSETDTYVYNIGDGNDIITDHGTGGAIDVLQFGTGIAPGDLRFALSATDTDDIVITFAGQAGSILLNEKASSFDYGPNEFRFADGTVWSEAQILAAYVAQQTSAAGDVIRGTYGVDVINGGAGNDTIYGNNGDDTIIGGLGDDILNGGEQIDTYIYDIGDGNDRITDFGTGGAVDTLVFGAGITPAMLHFSRSATDSDDIVISFDGVAGSVVLDEKASSFDYGPNQLQFSDGTIWSEAQILAAFAAAQQTANADTIHGTYGVDVIDGGAGNDTIYGKEGNDTLTGGLGDDNLQGGTNVDTYLYNLGDGNDVIYDESNDSSPDETLIFGAGITPEMLVFSRVTTDWDDIRISFEGQSGSIILNEQNQSDAGVETIIFADGTIWDEATMLAHYVADQQTAGDDVINGSNLADFVEGGAGNDTIVTGAGNDILIGGVGVDRLDGGSGTDTFRFYDGDSLIGALADTIVNFARGTDKIDLTAIDAQIGVPEDQAFIFLGTAAFTQQQGQLRYQIEGSNTRLQADVNGDGLADFEIILTGTGALTSVDFLL